jgi:cellulose synthase/poly-beta-1,6-N-acetylglucosamine synthase-like glycosyltransferase
MRQRVRDFVQVRLGEILIPAATWLVITLPIWLSPFHPAVVAYFIIAFELYFLYKSITTCYNATITYRKIQLVSRVSFLKKVLKTKNANTIQHFIIIPNYKEPVYKLESTIKSIVSNDYPYKNLHLVLAFEAREEEAKEKERYFRENYKKHFKDIIASYHILQPHEVPGKASNQTSAAKDVTEYVKRKGYDPLDCAITVCDADSYMPHNFFSYMTYKFARDPERKFHFYWAPVLLYNNFWDLPFFVRIQATLSSILRLAFLNEKEKLIQISTYTTNLWLLQEIDYWDVDIIPEDWHVHFQAFFKFGEKVKTIPLYTIVNGDAVYSGSIFKTLLNRYDQEKRWAWGVTDVSYMWTKLFSTPHIPLWTKLKKMFYVGETHFLWPTSFFILTVSASIPPLVNPAFKRTVLGFLLPELAGLILTFSSLLLIVYIYLDVSVRNKLKVGNKVIFLPLLLIQWYLLPVVSFILSSLPALEAHTRILIGKKITYKVTEKV